MEPNIQNSVNLDADEAVFFEKELESVKTRVFDIKYPALKAKQMIPVASDAGAGAETISYKQFDTVGMMKIISNYADDLPRSDVRGKEFFSPVRSIGGSYGYSIQTIRSAIMAGRPIKDDKAKATRRSYETTINDIAWNARPGLAKYRGLTGFLYNTNVTKYVVDAGAGGSTFATKTSEEIIFDMNKAVDTPIKLTKGVEVANTLLMPLGQHTLISSKKNSEVGGSDLTVLEYFKRNRPGVMVEWVNELEAVTPIPRTGSGTADIMIAYRRDPEILTLEIPVAFEQFKAQERNLEFVIPAHGRIGGVIIYYPLAIAQVDGI